MRIVRFSGLWCRALAAVLVAGIAAGSSSIVLAKSAARQGSAVSGRLSAPTQEDHASYFSDNRSGASPAAQEKADQLRRKTISSIESLLESSKKGVRRFELLLRLGELHVERHDYLRDIETNQYIQAHDTWQKDKKGTEPKPSFAGSEGELTKAANSFRRLVNEFPKHPRTDAALYSLARTLGRLGKETAVDYYKQMIKGFPKSPLLPDAYLSLGEYYFDKHNIPEALANYKKAMEFKNHKAYPYAVYKLGWAHYNASAKDENETAQNYKKAVAAFKLVVKLSDKDKQKRNLNLREEAIRDLVMVWAESEDVASAWKYFKTIGEDDSFYKMLERLGHIYFEQGKNEKAVAVFQRLLKDAPKRDNNPAIHAKILELYDLTNDIPAVVAELRNMHKLYLGTSAWVAANQKTPAAIEEARRLVENNTHRYGAMFHQRGQKAKSEGYLKHAAETYKIYLTSFADSANAYDIRYYLAELLYDFKQYEAASGHYLTVAKADPKGKYLKTAAINAVGAMNQVVQTNKWPALPPAGQVPAPLEIPEAKQKLVKVIDQYVQLLPQEKEGHAMRFTAAQTFFDYGHYPEATARYERIIKEIPDTKQGKASARMILGFHADKEEWAKLITWCQTFSKNERLLDADLKKYVVDLLRGAMFKRALADEKAQKYERAAKSFIEYQKEFPQDANADRALYNAMLNYYKVGRVENAVTTGDMLLEKYPKSQLVPDVVASVGSTHESLARFAEAAAMYKKLAQGFPDDKRAPNALFNAAVLYRGLGNADESARLFGEFERRWPGNKIAVDAGVNRAEILEKKGDFREAVEAWEGVAKRHAGSVDIALFASAKAASLKAQHMNREQGLRDMEKVRKSLTAKGSPAAIQARSVVAETIFKQNEASFASYQAVKFTDGSKIEKQVSTKQEQLERLAGEYEKIVDIGSAEYVVAALYRLGEAHENFAEALFKAPAPKGASQVDIDKYRTELEKVAFPLKEEAYKFFETAFKRSREVDTFTAWTRRTYQKMVDLAPDKHAAVDEISAEPGYLSHDIVAGQSVAELFTE